MTTPDPLVALLAEELEAEFGGWSDPDDYVAWDLHAERILAHPALRARLEDTERLRAALEEASAALIKAHQTHYSAACRYRCAEMEANVKVRRILSSLAPAEAALTDGGRS